MTTNLQSEIQAKEAELNELKDREYKASLEKEAKRLASNATVGQFEQLRGEINHIIETLNKTINFQTERVIKMKSDYNEQITELMKVNKRLETAELILSTCLVLVCVGYLVSFIAFLFL